MFKSAELPKSKVFHGEEMTKLRDVPNVFFHQQFLLCARCIFENFLKNIFDNKLTSKKEILEMLFLCFVQCRGGNTVGTGM